MKRTISIFATLCLALAGCSKSDSDPGISFNVSSLSLYADQTHQLFQSSSDVNVTSSNDFAATVSKRGLVTAKHVGSATISAGSSTCQVTIKPRYTPYPDPYTTWGASKSTVKAKLGTPYSETTTGLVYQISSTTIAAYQFENDKLTGVGVAVSTAYTSQISSALVERYVMINANPSANFGDIIAMYINANSLEAATVVVGIELVNINAFLIIYIPNTAPTSRSSYDYFKEQFKIMSQK